MLIILFIIVAAINFSTAFSKLDNVIEYVPCERGWYYWGGKCYKVRGRKDHERLSWTSALEKCKSQGGDLVSIESQEEQDFIVSFLLLDLQAETWIGLNDRESEGIYKWTDGTLFNYTNWRIPSEPSGNGLSGDDEDCVHMSFQPDKVSEIGQWNDRHCDAPNRYVCEKKSNPRRRSRSPNPIYCSSDGNRGWKWDDSCYHVVKAEYSWQNAEKHCKNYYNGHLVSILDSVEDLFLDYILADIKQEVWIGIKILEQWQQKWTSGWYVSYNGFEKEINFIEGTCVARKKRNEWVTIPCTKPLSFICKVSEETPPVLKAPAKGSRCPVEFDGWRDLGGEYCYYFETEKSLNFYEALFDCKRKGGNLASLHSKEESDTILPFVKFSTLGWSSWIGLFRLFSREDEFSWTDGSAVNYLNWWVNEPNGENENCVEVHTHEIVSLYRWNDNSCDEKRGYICSVKKILQNSDHEEDDCQNFCISSRSYLYEVVQQSSDAKKCSEKRLSKC